MTTPALDPTAFAAMFPALASVSTPALQGYWTMANGYIAESFALTGDRLQLALNLMTAHLAQSFQIINGPSGNGAGGSTPGVVIGGSEGSVSASMAPPPTKSGWQYWLATTAYGQQLWALLQIRGAGGFYIGGSLERASFRKAGGVW